MVSHNGLRQGDLVQYKGSESCTYIIVGCSAMDEKKVYIKRAGQGRYTTYPATAELLIKVNKQ